MHHTEPTTPVFLHLRYEVSWSVVLFNFDGIYLFLCLKDYRDLSYINYILMHNLEGIKIELDQK